MLERLRRSIRLLRQNGRPLTYVLLSFVILFIVIYVFWRVPIKRLQDFSPYLQPKEYIEIENSIRSGLAQAIGGAAILLGLFFTWRNIKATEKNLRITQEATARNLFISQEGQITERFTRAIEQLGSDKLQVRLGGIYALERIARDSKQDHWPVMEILTAFVRATASAKLTAEIDTASEPPTDIQAVLNVLARRQAEYEQGSKQRVDLRGSILVGANVIDCNLEKAILWGTHFEGANLRGTHLEDAGLSRAFLNSAQLIACHLERASLAEADMEQAVCTNAYLEGAQLNNANLRGAKLYDTNLSGASLLEADLTGASLQNANLSGAILKRAKLDMADLEGADLTDAVYLTLGQVRSAINYDKAKLPLHIQEQLKDKREARGNA